MTENKHKPAFPRPGYEHSNLADHARYYHEDGLTKREIFAKDAPEVPPDWFRTNYGNKNSHALWDGENLFFAWRIYYADKMLAELDQTLNNDENNS
jgi:hypothetical protein